ncbi:unnamed protein product [Rotaria socialis]|uniref:EF-hand domain-containing protein n=1 Tax=Rotaria socialis TaxID=392032 RepID=A0A817XGA9_9BILA|nr:unnamed protein product [Rotaria socialis]CAF4690194.1 unnamed protein product [Rotaria socialis]
MFTILPSLYLIGVHYFRQWKTPYYQEKINKQIFEINNNNINDNTKKIENDFHIVIDQPSISLPLRDNDESTSDLTSDRSNSIRSHKKKSHRRQRRTLTNGLSRDNINYLMNKTGLNQESILISYEDFLRDCPDGKLSKNKFFDIYQQYYKKGHVNKFCDHAFQLFDKDGSGYIEFMEFIVAVSLISSKDPARKIELFFAMYDIDHNGFIDEKEMRSFVESIYELMGIDISDPSRVVTKVHDIFSTAKCDSLGYLGKEQFAEACQNDRHIRKLLMPTIKSTNNQEN